MTIWYVLRSFGTFFSSFGNRHPEKIWQPCTESWDELIRFFCGCKIEWEAMECKEGNEGRRDVFPSTHYRDCLSTAGWPDLANFRTMGDCLLLRYFFDNYRRSPQCFATFLHSWGCALILTKKELGYILGDYLNKLVWSPCSTDTAPKALLPPHLFPS
jgi:hypothetical protein